MKDRILRSVLFLVVSISLNISLNAADKGTPRWLVETFFSGKEFPEMQRYYTGEMLKHYWKSPPMGAYMPPGFHLDCTILEQTPEETIWRATYTDSPKSGDWYAFIVREDGEWKIKAVRTLALPPFIDSLYTQLSNKNYRTEKEEETLQNLIFARMSDKDLKTAFKPLKARLEIIRDLMRKNEKDPEIDARLKPLNMISHGIGQHSELLIVIGGILDNSVGYMYVPKGTSVPKMEPGNYILIEEIEDGWYLYKTT